MIRLHPKPGWPLLVALLVVCVVSAACALDDDSGDDDDATDDPGDDDDDSGEPPVGQDDDDDDECGPNTAPVLAGWYLYQVDPADETLHVRYSDEDAEPLEFVWTAGSRFYLQAYVDDPDNVDPETLEVAYEWDDRGPAVAGTLDDGDPFLDEFGSFGWIESDGGRLIQKTFFLDPGDALEPGRRTIAFAPLDLCNASPDDESRELDLVLPD